MCAGLWAARALRVARLKTAGALGQWQVPSLARVRGYGAAGWADGSAARRRVPQRKHPAGVLLVWMIEVVAVDIAQPVLPQALW